MKSLRFGSVWVDVVVVVVVVEVLSWSRCVWSLKLEMINGEIVIYFLSLGEV